jgi:hypothetical protein
MPLRIAGFYFEVSAFTAAARISSSRHLARPTPETGRGVDGSVVPRQRVVAAVGQRSKPVPVRRGRG